MPEDKRRYWGLLLPMLLFRRILLSLTNERKAVSSVDANGARGATFGVNVGF